jgi:hypothetical protein
MTLSLLPAARLPREEQNLCSLRHPNLEIVALADAVGEAIC